jgi:hypothetical protein
VPALLRQMEGTGRNAKVAFEAFSTLTGLDTMDLSFARNEGPDADEHEAEFDSAEQDAAHESADDLLAPDAEAVACWWSERAAAFSPGARWLGGRPFELSTAREFLLSAPLRRRHLIADLVRIHARGQLALDTCARPAWQHAQLASWGSIRLDNPYAGR